MYVIVSLHTPSSSSSPCCQNLLFWQWIIIIVCVKLFGVTFTERKWCLGPSLNTFHEVRYSLSSQKGRTVKRTRNTYAGILSNYAAIRRTSRMVAQNTTKHPHVASHLQSLPMKGLGRIFIPSLFPHNISSSGPLLPEVVIRSWVLVLDTIRSIL